MNPHDNLHHPATIGIRLTGHQVTVLAAIAARGGVTIDEAARLLLVDMIAAAPAGYTAQPQPDYRTGDKVRVRTTGMIGTSIGFDNGHVTVRSDTTGRTSHWHPDQLEAVS